MVRLGIFTVDVSAKEIDKKPVVIDDRIIERPSTNAVLSDVSTDVAHGFQGLKRSLGSIKYWTSR